MPRLDGKVALITGAGAGIGQAAAVLFAHEGAKLVIAELNESNGASTAKRIEDDGGEAIFVRTDVTDEQSVLKAVATAKKRFGRIDILFNCAGGSVAEDNPLVDIDDLKDVFDRTMHLNLYGSMLSCKAVIPEMITIGGGSVISMSSGAALRGASPWSTYTSAKGGIVALTRALAGTYARNGIRVNAIAAGRVHTARTLARYQAKRKPGSAAERHYAQEPATEYPFWVGEPIDIANIALFLASPESRMITGATIPADGGRSAY